MSFAELMVSFILTGMGMIALGVLAVAMAWTKRKTAAIACGVSALVLMAGVVASGLGLAVKGGLGFARSWGESSSTQPAESDFLREVKGYVDSGVLKTVDPEFYTCGGYGNWWRIPLVYPYSVQASDDFLYGRLCRHDGKTPIPAGKEIQLDPHNITHLALDGQFLLLRQAPGPASKDALVKWTLLEWATGKATDFPAQDVMLEEARKRGYVGPGQFATVARCYADAFGERPATQPAATQPAATQPAAARPAATQPGG